MTHTTLGSCSRSLWNICCFPFLFWVAGRYDAVGNYRNILHRFKHMSTAAWTNARQGHADLRQEVSWGCALREEWQNHDTKLDLEWMPSEFPWLRVPSSSNPIPSSLTKAFNYHFISTVNCQASVPLFPTSRLNKLCAINLHCFPWEF